jgi:hypothetical protein
MAPGVTVPSGFVVQWQESLKLDTVERLAATKASDTATS